MTHETQNEEQAVTPPPAYITTVSTDDIPPPSEEMPPPRADTPPPRVETPPPRVETPPPRAETPPPRAETPPYEPTPQFEQEVGVILRDGLNLFCTFYLFSGHAAPTKASYICFSYKWLGLVFLCLSFVLASLF